MELLTAFQIILCIEITNIMLLFKIENMMIAGGRKLDKMRTATAIASGGRFSFWFQVSFDCFLYSYSL